MPVINRNSTMVLICKDESFVVSHTGEELYMEQIHHLGGEVLLARYNKMSNLYCYLLTGGRVLCSQVGHRVALVGQTSGIQGNVIDVGAQSYEKSSTQDKAKVAVLCDTGALYYITLTKQHDGTEHVEQQVHCVESFCTTMCCYFDKLVLIRDGVLMMRYGDAINITLGRVPIPNVRGISLSKGRVVMWNDSQLLVADSQGGIESPTLLCSMPNVQYAEAKGGSVMVFTTKGKVVVRNDGHNLMLVGGALDAKYSVVCPIVTKDEDTILWLCCRPHQAFTVGYRSNMRTVIRRSCELESPLGEGLLTHASLMRQESDVA